MAGLEREREREVEVEVEMAGGVGRDAGGGRGGGRGGQARQPICVAGRSWLEGNLCPKSHDSGSWAASSGPSPSVHFPVCHWEVGWDCMRDCMWDCMWDCTWDCMSVMGMHAMNAMNATTLLEVT